MTRAAAMLALAAAACGSGGGGTAQREVQVVLRLDESSCFLCSSPDDCPLDCGGQVGIFMLDPVAGTVLDSVCNDLPATMGYRLRDLTTHLPNSRFQFPDGTQLAVEIVVYPSRDGCPLVERSEDGYWGPTPSGTFPLYAGRSAVYTLDEDGIEIAVDLDCVEVSPVSCTTFTPTVQAYVKNVSTLVPVSYEEAMSFDVHGGYIVYQGMTPPYPVTMNPFVDLQLSTQTGDALFEADGDFGFFDCVGMLVTRIGAGPTVSTASCEVIIQEPGSFTLAQGYYLDKPRFDEIIALPGLAGFAGGGLLVGRITESGLPAQEIEVRPQGAGSTATVRYFEEDVTGALVERSSGSWFVVTAAIIHPLELGGTEARCCEVFDAYETGTSNWRGSTTGPIGLIDGVVMSTHIELF